MFKKILYVSLFVLIFLLAVQSVSASDTNLNDIYSDNLDFDESLSVYDSSNQDSSIGDDSLISDENESYCEVKKKKILIPDFLFIVSLIHSKFDITEDSFVMYLTGIENIRDVIPYPRTPNNCDY